MEEHWADKKHEILLPDPYQQAKLLAMYEVYADLYPKDKETYFDIAVELSYQAPLLNIAHTGGKSHTWELQGKVDLVMRRADDQCLIIGEHKTTSADISPESDYWRLLRLDSQVSGYAYGIETITGARIDACLYDVARKPMIRPKLATPEADRKYTKDGRLYANQREADETPVEFFNRCLETMRAEPEKYFQRRTIYRNDEDLGDYMCDMWGVSRMIRECELADRWPKNPSRCTEWGGCEYFKVCTGQCSISDDNEFKTVIPNPELQEVAE
jgi:hypothetical protein